MGSKILPVCTYRPIGTYLVQEKVMQEQVRWGWRINIFIAEVEKNTELLRKALHEIEGLKDVLMDILRVISLTQLPPSPKEN